MTDFPTLFDYDLWANSRWFPLCSHEDLAPIMNHILNAQSIWLERVAGTRLPITGDFAAEAAELNRRWKAHLEGADIQEVVHYRNLQGDPYSDERANIVQHVINHGTYHRGQLRGMVERLGIAEFPETDLIRYLRER
jgi:uncharacterized damage-inducible protein DinB